MKTNIGIPGNNIEEIAMVLNTLLADEYLLNTKTRSAQWNVTGPNFAEMNEFFKAQSIELDVIIDSIAERIRALGHFVLGDMKDYLELTHLPGENHDFSSAKQIIRTLLNDHETIIRIIRNEIAPVSQNNKDLGTADFLTGMMEHHERMARSLRAFMA